MGLFGLTINNRSTLFGNIATQATPLLNNTAITNNTANSNLIQNSATPEAASQTAQVAAVIAPILPPVIVSTALAPIVQQSNPTIPTVSITNNSGFTTTANLTRILVPTINPDVINSNITNNVNSATSVRRAASLATVNHTSLINPIFNDLGRDITIPPYRIPKVKNPVNTISPPNADTLKLTEITIESNSFQSVDTNGISVFRPEILGLLNFKPIFRSENKNEFTHAGKFVSLNYQTQILRRSTLDKIFQKIQQSGDQTLQTPLINAMNLSNNTFTTIDKRLTVFANNASSINDIKNAFNPKEIEDSAYNTAKFLTLKQFFEQKMQYDENSYHAFSDTKVLMQLLFDLRSSLEGYSFSLLNLIDDDRKNDLNPITLDKTYKRNNNFTFSIESIRSSGPSGRLAMDSNEFTQFINSLPADLSDRLKLLLHLFSKELRVSRGLSLPEIRSTLQNLYSANQDGDPFDNIIGSLGKDIFDSVEGVNSLANLTQIFGSNFIVLPFETKTVDDSQTTYVPGSRYFADAILNSRVGFDLDPFNTYTSKYSELLAKADNIMEQFFQFTNQNFDLLPEEVFLNYLQSLQDSLSSLGSNSSNSNNDQLIFAAIMRLASKNNTLKLMLFQFFLLTGIASNDKQDNKKIFQRLIDDVQNEIRKFSFVRVNTNDDPDLTKGLQSLRPFLEKLAEDIENKIFELVNPRAASSVVFSPILRSLRSTDTNFNSRLPFGVVFGDSNKLTPSINSTIQSRTANASVRTGVSSTTPTTLKRNVFDRNTIKNILLSGVTAVGNSATNLLKEFVDLAVKFDGQTSIQGNRLSYVLENNSTRFNYISTSHLLLFIFEILGSFISRFFIADFTETNNSSKISLTYDDIQNQSMFDYIKELTSQRNKKTSPFILNSPYVRQAILSAPPPLRNLEVSPAFSLQVRPTTTNPVQGGLGALSQITANIFNSINASSPVGSVPRNNTANSLAGISLSAMLENIANMSNTATNSRVGLFNQRIGFAGAVIRDFASPAVGIESLRDAVARNLLPIRRTLSLNQVSLFTPIIRKLNDLKQTLTGIRDKIKEEDVYLQNSFHILDVIGDRLSLVNTRVNRYFSSLNAFDKETINLYKDTIKDGQIKTSNWLERTYRTNVNLSGSFNSVYRDEYYSMVSLLSEKFYTTTLAKDRVKLFSIGVPAGFSEKLVDRVSKSEINVDTFKNLESDIVHVNVYKKNSVNDDIIYYPQKFLFDLSLFPKEITNLSIDPKIPFDNQMERISLLSFEDMTNINGESVDINTLTSNEKYSFMTRENIKEMMRNHIVSHLLQTYTYLLTGLNFSEEVFPDTPYTNLGPNATLNPTTEALLRAYYKASLGFNYSSQSSIINVLFDRTTPDNIKDDIQLMLYGSNTLKPDLVESKVLDDKKFDRIFFIPINIDEFIVNVDQTNQTTSGKRAFAQQSYQDTLIKISVGNNTLFKENRDTIKDTLIFEEYFVTIDLAKKV